MPTVKLWRLMKDTGMILFREEMGWKLVIKRKVNIIKLPKFLRAFIYFFVRYICFGGFLDGKPGFIWATLQAYWYRYLIDAKIEEMEYYIGKNPTPKEMRMYFKERFNINVDK